MFRVLFLFAAVFYVVEATVILPNPTVTSKCNIYKKDLCWALVDCICRPFQNPCLRDAENALRIENCKTPIVPVTEELCKHFIPKVCLWGRPVKAYFPKPPKCGCPDKPGTIDELTFKNFCQLQKYSAEKNEAYVSYKKCSLLK
ncbi:salivary glue protein Sgs-5 [Drosophila virilis]|uniref:salivary glue protein Sgs-5 n=1 Tax=Drosophila virilis TaxID=7244 RepID=UPI00017D4C94|nr:salivary glue protein Sgs-5 [Drosophila virilis]